MRTPRLLGSVLATLALARFSPAADARPDTAGLIAAQREAMAPLAICDGVWRGPATTVLPSGDRHSIVQTERVGPFLGGSIKVIEGRGYDTDGKVSFNAFGVISYNSSTRTYNFRSYAQGFSGDFVMVPRADGFTWEIPAGGATMRYTAVITGGVWTEIGERIVPGKEPVRFFEMKLKRIGDTEWPGGGAIGRE